MKTAIVVGLLAVTWNLPAAEPSGQPTSVAAPTNATAKVTNAPAPNLGEIFKAHYANRVRSFQEQNLAGYTNGGNVILLGDSITEGLDVKKHFPDQRVLNRGIGADVIGNALPADDSRGILRRLDNSVFDCAPTDVFLLIGINDLGSGRKPEVMEKGYREILQRIRERTPAVRLHVQSVLPTSGKYAKHNAPVLDFNQRLRRLAAEFNCDYLDLHQLMTNDQGELTAELTKEGLHLTEAAYVIWSAEIRKVMEWK